MDEAITRCDLWLVQQPKLPLDCLVAIYSRAMFCDWVFYGDAHRELKHLMLLRLRDHYRDFQKLPQAWQEALWPCWERWRAEFLDEEMRTGSGSKGISPGWVGQRGQKQGNHITDDKNTGYTGEKKFTGKNFQPVKFGNEVALNVGKGGPGTGRTTYASGSQDCHGTPEQGSPRPNPQHDALENE